MNLDSRILVTGHRGLAGSAILWLLAKQGYRNLITLDHGACDLTDPVAVKWAFSSYLPEYVFHCAAKVGGIVANSKFPVEFMDANMRMELNVLQNAHEAEVKKLLFLGSACAYPKYAPQPIKEEYLLEGILEPSNECYALAKIAGIKLCDAYRREYGCDFISAMPTNLYGIGDHYSLEDSHVIPGMIRRLHEAKKSNAASVKLWGTGNPTREFLYADDLAEACHALMQCPDYLGLVNIGTGQEVALHELALSVLKTIRYCGDILWDKSKPDGTPARRMDSSKISSIGWHPKTSLEEGLKLAYKDFLCQEL